jgi:hypothetical protein
MLEMNGGVVQTYRVYVIVAAAAAADDDDVRFYCGW